DRPPPYGGLVPRSSRQRAEGEPQANIFNFPVVIGERSHPFPFRTRKLSSLPPMVLRGKLRGRVGHCRDYFEGPSPIATGLFFHYPRGFAPRPSLHAHSLAALAALLVEPRPHRPTRRREPRLELPDPPPQVLPQVPHPRILVIQRQHRERLVGTVRAEQRHLRAEARVPRRAA